MASRTTPAGNQTFGGFAPSSFANGIAGGWIGYNEKITDTTGVVGTEVTLVSVTAPVNASRRIRVTGYVSSWISTVTGDRAQFRLLEGATQLQMGRSTVQLAGIATEPPTVLGRVLTPGAAASHTYTLVVARNAGTGTLTISGDPTTPMWIMVEDLGPA